jgi:hypothetical protein
MNPPHVLNLPTLLLMLFPLMLILLLMKLMLHPLRLC